MNKWSIGSKISAGARRERSERGFAAGRRKGYIAKDDVALVGGNNKHFFERSVTLECKGKPQRVGRPAGTGKGRALNRRAVAAIPEAYRWRCRKIGCKTGNIIIERAHGGVHIVVDAQQFLTALDRQRRGNSGNALAGSKNAAIKTISRGNTDLRHGGLLDGGKTAGKTGSTRRIGMSGH